MAFKMKLGSKDLDGLYSINNKQTEAIKSGSGGLGMAGQVPDGPGSQGEAMSPHNMMSPAYQNDDEIKLDNVDLPVVESGAARDARIQTQMKKTRSQVSNKDAKDKSQDFAAQKDLTALNNQSESDPEAYKKNVQRISQPKPGQNNVNISQADLRNSKRGRKIRQDYRDGKTS